MGTALATHRGCDLNTTQEIEVFVERFYRVLVQDETFQPHFASIDWNAHMLTMVDFWKHALLGADTYDLDHETVMEHHRPMHAEGPFVSALFDRWVEVLYEILDDGWTGPVATQARRRGHGIAWAMAKRFTDTSIGRVR